MPILTRDHHPKRTERVLLFRADQRIWEIGKIDLKYLEHPNYAYTHWEKLPGNPND